MHPTPAENLHPALYFYLDISLSRYDISQKIAENRHPALYLYLDISLSRYLYLSLCLTIMVASVTEAADSYKSGSLSLSIYIYIYI